MMSKQINDTAWALLRAGQLRAAVQEWSGLALELCDAGNGWAALGVAYTLLNVTEGASGELRRAALWVMVEVSQSVGELGEAERWAQEMIQQSDGRGSARVQAGAWIVFGELAEGCGDLHEAVGRWERALEGLDEKREADVAESALLRLGSAHRRLGNHARADECAERAERLSARLVA